MYLSIYRMQVRRFGSNREMSYMCPDCHNGPLCVRKYSMVMEVEVNSTFVLHPCSEARMPTLPKVVG